MRVSRVLGLLVVLLLITACNSGPSEEEFSPKIGDINTAILQLRTGSSTEDPATDDVALGFSFVAKITDPDGVGDIDSIRVRHEESGLTFTVLSVSGLNEGCSYFSNLFNCSFRMSEEIETFSLSGFEVIAVDIRRYTTTKSFDLKSLTGDELNDETFAYSEKYSGDTVFGIEALEAMSVENNDIEVSLDNDSEMLNVEFETTDSRADTYYLSLSSRMGDTKFRQIGLVPASNSDIQNSPIIFGHKTVVSIDYDDIQFSSDDYSVEDIEGITIVLGDEPVESSTGLGGGLWSNYTGLSERYLLEP